VKVNDSGRAAARPISLAPSQALGMATDHDAQVQLAADYKHCTCSIHVNARASAEAEGEIWRPIPSRPGYEASSLGAIRKIGAVRCKPQFPGNNEGHLQVRLKGPRYVHHLVAEAFHSHQKAFLLKQGLKLSRISGCGGRRGAC
jgi:hypothetical protein